MYILLLYCNVLIQFKSITLGFNIFIVYGQVIFHLWYNHCCDCIIRLITLLLQHSKAGNPKCNPKVMVLKREKRDVCGLFLY